MEYDVQQTSFAGKKKAPVRTIKTPWEGINVLLVPPPDFFRSFRRSFLSSRVARSFLHRAHFFQPAPFVPTNRTNWQKHVFEVKPVSGKKTTRKPDATTFPCKPRIDSEKMFWFQLKLTRTELHRKSGISIFSFNSPVHSGST